MAVWLRFLENWLTQQLLRSQTFHKAVGNIHRRIYYRGKPPPEHEQHLFTKPEEYDNLSSGSDGTEPPGAPKPLDEVKKFARIFGEEWKTAFQNKKNDGGGSAGSKPR